MWRTGGIFSTPAGGSLPLRGRWLAAGETDEGTKPSPGRGWLGEAGTGVGRYRVGPGTAPLPALGGVPFIRDFCGRQVVSPHPSRALPVPPSPRGKATSRRGLPGRKTLSLRDGCGKKPLLGEGGPGKARDGSGAVPGRTWCRPSSGPGGPPSPRGR